MKKRGALYPSDILALRGALYPSDILALIVIVFGCLGFIFWGLGYSSIGNETLKWIGASIVALISFLAAILSRWLR